MPVVKTHFHKPRGRTQVRRRSSTRKAFHQKPRIDPQLKHTFKKIGVPSPSPFTPDSFQLEALDRIETVDVLVSAPTGSGKTWIASEAITKYLSKGLKIWYASPLKALSNSIYQEFSREFGSKYCGILTGDRKENPGAPVIIGTTEILRNQLYDAMHEGVNIDADLVILDEAHYLSDPDRGVVWEEVLIYLPSRVRLLLLSATISNAEEITTWLEENRGGKPWIVRSVERPVPLDMLFLFPDGLISPLAGKRGLTPKVKRFVASQAGHGRRGGPARLDFGEIIKCLRTFDLLPAIFFLKSRMDCNRALQSCYKTERPYEVRERFEREVKDFLRLYPHLKGHRQMRPLMESMVGSHHAGQLPYWKLLIEKMMIKGYLDAIFSTSTVAAGVNFPARTVVLVQSDRYDGREFSNLTATELHQMTGRAGRRGKDNIGFAVIIPGLHQDPQLIDDLRDSSPEPLMSRIHINFSMTLNLLLSHRPEEVKDLLSRSFAAFQERKRGSSFQKEWDERVRDLKATVPEGRCDTADPYEIIEYIQTRTELRQEAKRASKDLRKERVLGALERILVPGRLFLHKNKNIYVSFHTEVDRGRFICRAHNLKKRLQVRKGRLRLRRVDTNQIKAFFDYRVDLSDELSPDRLDGLFAAIPLEDLGILPADFSGGDDEAEGASAPEQGSTKTLPCEECVHLRLCHGGKKGRLQSLLRDFKSLTDQMERAGGGLWLSFRRHLRFLKLTGFVAGEDRLTPDGIWASKLRLDHPLLIAEAIRRGGFAHVTPEMMASCLAPFVWDRIQDLDLRVQSPVELQGMEDAFHRILGCIEGIRGLMVRRGFEDPQILFWPGAALYLWCRGVTWKELLFSVPVDEGDMASLIVRTADHLRQVTNLAETHPDLASTALKAIDLILREPVLIE
ncbi:MAG: DEAD/DEAH box helicase [Proteobacteria bacterium]|nr:DEAD/DEAH box helicase [Pseudomonadota bacterium]